MDDRFVTCTFASEQKQSHESAAEFFRRVGNPGEQVLGQSHLLGMGRGPTTTVARREMKIKQLFSFSWPERGVNQSGLLADLMADQNDLPSADDDDRTNGLAASAGQKESCTQVS